MKTAREYIALLIVCALLSSCAAPPQAPQSTSTVTTPKLTPKAQPVPAKGPLKTTVAADYGELVLVEGGVFIMGDIYGNDQFAKPPHKVSINDFYMARHEVTFEDYDRFCTDTGRTLPDDNGWGRGNRPVINVTHPDAVAFTTWLSKKTGRTFRLPSEAEWEYAARAGKSTNFWWGTLPGSGNANCKQCGSRWDGRMTAPVGSFSPNSYGLYDVHGNVYEWVADSWYENYQGAPIDGSARVEPEAKQYVSRGGSFQEIPVSLHVYSRNWTNGSEPSRDIGFRVVMEP